MNGKWKKFFVKLKYTKMISDLWNVPAEKMFPRKKIFFVRAAPPLPPPRPYKFVWTLTTLEGITYYIQNTLKHPYCKTNMHNKFDRPISLILEI